MIGAVNAFNGQVNVVTNQTNQKQDTIPNVAFDYKAKNVPWVIIADSNYGEGSAREHAAMQPRFLGCKMVISRSFARIHGNYTFFTSHLIYDDRDQFKKARYSSSNLQERV